MNQRPKSTWQPSPNFTTKLRPRPITLIVIHCTATDNKESPLNWLCDKNSQRSCHYLIDARGMIYALVNEANVSWHAGESKWKGMEYVNPKSGRSTVNNCSIGVELVHPNKPEVPYQPEQIEACAELCAAIGKEYSIGASDVVGHMDIAPGRKFDPAGFNWGKFREMLLMRGLGA